MNSRKSLANYIKEISTKTKQLKDLERLGVPVPEKKSLERELDWLGAHEWFVQQRANPSDEVDWKIYDRALTYRKQMKSKRPEFIPSRIPAKNQEATDYPDSTWAFVGPKDMDSPGGGGGPSPVAGRVAGIAISYQNPDTVWYVAGGCGGVFKTTDGGTTWDDLTNSTWDSMYVGDIAVDPTNENIIYAGLGDYDDYQRWGRGIMKSTNGGATWTLREPAANFDTPIADIMIDPDDHNRIFIACGRGNNQGVWLSEDGGLTWTRELIGDFHSLSYSTRVNNVRYFWASGTVNLMRSDDGGDTWAGKDPNFSTYGTSAVACSKVNQQTIYCMTSNQLTIYKSTNNGEDWSVISNNFVHGNASAPTGNWNQSSYDWYLETSRTSTNQDVIFVGLLDLVTSRNGGATWSNTGGHFSAGATIHVDHHVAVNHPTNSDVMFLGSDGGIYKVTWNTAFGLYAINAAANTNLPIAMFYYFAAHPSNTSYFMGGLQDNGTTHSFGNTAQWGSVGGADGTGCAIYQPNTAFQFRTTQRAGAGAAPDGTTFMNIKWTQNSWTGSATATSAVDAGDSVVFAPPITANPSGAFPTVYIGSEWLYRLQIVAGLPVFSRHLGNRWFTDSISAIAVAPSDVNVLYVATETGKLWRSGDAGNTWNNILDRGRYITCISVDPNNANSILLTATGEITDGNLWRCTNTTAATPVFTDRSGLVGSSPLPGIWTNWIERDPWRPTTVWYVANDLGVFYTDDAGINWYDMTQAYGMPPVAVRQLTAVEGTNRLYAATYGRGVYRMLINDTRPIVSEVAWLTTEVTGGNLAVLNVTFDKVTPPDGLNLTLSYSPLNVVPNAPTNVTVPGGRTNYLIGVPTAVVGSDTLLIGSAQGQYGGNLGAFITVRSVEMTNFTISPVSVVGSHNATGTIFLNRAAPSGGVVVSLQTDNSAVATVPATMTIPSGNQTGTFTISTKAQTSNSTATILANFGGTSLLRDITATFTNLSNHVITNTNITSGNLFSGTVTIHTAAGPQGVPVNLSSNNPNAVVPAQVIVTNGNTQATYLGVTTIFTGSTQSATITANRGSSFYPETISLQPVNVSTVVVPAEVAPGSSFPVTVNLTRAAPSAGVTVNLSSSHPKIAKLTQSSVFIPAGQTSVTARIGRAQNASSTPVTITGNHLTSTKIGTVKVVSNPRP